MKDLQYLSKINGKKMKNWKMAGMICLFFLSFHACETTGGILGSGNQVFKTPTEFLSPEVVSMLQDKDAKVTVYQLRPKAETGDKKIYGYPIKKKGPKLSQAQTKELFGILLSKDTYDFSMAKRGMFIIPTYAFQIQSQGKESAVLFDFYRKEVLVIHQDRKAKEDFDNAFMQIDSMVKNLFPQ